MTCITARILGIEQLHEKHETDGLMVHIFGSELTDKIPLYLAR